MDLNQGLSGLEGFTGVVGEPLFLGLFDTADNVAIDTIWQNEMYEDFKSIPTDI